MGCEAWGQRYASCTDPLMRKYMEISEEKQSLVCLAADKSTMQEMFDLLEKVAPFIAVLKTHVDLIDDWNMDEWMRFCKLANDSGLLIFEDRKFADIGKISQQQMGGVYNIRSWADLVTSHLISGPDIVDGLQKGWGSVNKMGSVLLLAQMSSRGNLLLPDYCKNVVKLGCAHSGVLGFIGNGSDAEGIISLRNLVGENKMIWTPGVNISVGDGDLGQRYGDPRQAILAGSDCIIVGSGIHQSVDPSAAAMEYAKVSWAAFCER